MTRFWGNLGRIGKKVVGASLAPEKALLRGASQLTKGPVSSFLAGSPETRENVSSLRPEQEPLYNQAVQAGLGQGAGGAFGQSADYYRGLLSDDSADYNAFAAPALRQYSQDIVPALSEQFAGMGAGGLSSSGFRNAQIQGATDLAERLGQIRANLRQAGAQGLQHAGQFGLQNYSQNMTTQPGTQGFLSQIAPGVGTGIGTLIGGALGGPPGAAAGGLAGSAGGNALSSWFGNTSGNKVGQNTGAYQGGGGQSSPQLGNYQPRQLPNRSL